MRQYPFLPVFVLLICVSNDLAAHERVDGAIIETEVGMQQQASRWHLCGGDSDCMLEAVNAERGGAGDVRPPLMAPPDIVDAIQRAANFVGVDFEYMLRVAALESSYDEATEAKTSTAVGLFQLLGS